MMPVLSVLHTHIIIFKTVPVGLFESSKNTDTLKVNKFKANTGLILFKTFTHKLCVKAPSSQPRPVNHICKAS